MRRQDELPLNTPDQPEPQTFTDPKLAVAHLIALYEGATRFLCDRFSQTMQSGHPGCRYRAYYPEIRITTSSYAKIDSRLSFGHVARPGAHATTITRPDLFRNYLEQQIGLLLMNHDVPVQIGLSDTPIPVHFAVANDSGMTVPQEGAADFILRDVFDVPDLNTMNDDIVNGTYKLPPDGTEPLAAFTAQRVDYSLARLAHYTATDPVHFQNHVLFTNYQFYVSEFEAYARKVLADPESGYISFVSTGNVEITDPQAPLPIVEKVPQMPDYPLKRQHRRGHIQCKDGHRSYRGAAPACLDHGRSLCGSQELAIPWGLCPRPCLSARGQGAGRRFAGVGPHPCTGRDPDRVAAGRGRGNATSGLRSQAGDADGDSGFR